MLIPDALLNYFFSVELAPTSARWYKQKLYEFQAYLKSQGVHDTSGIQPLHIATFLRSRQAGPQTVHGYARVVRAWLRFGVRDGWYREEDLKRWSMPRKSQPLIATYTQAQCKALLAATESQLHPDLSYRDRSIILTLLDTGIRASELCGLTTGRVHLALEDAYLIVDGKGQKTRATGRLGKQARNALHTYLTRYRSPRAGVEAVYLADDGHPLTVVGLDRMLKRLRDRAHITGVRVSAHTFRHTYAVRYLSQPGSDIYKLKVLLGHSTVSTTEMYLRTYQAREARRGPSVIEGWL